MPDKCFLILGGGGMIGFQVAYRIARRLKPEKMIIASLYQKEVREALSVLERDFPAIEFVPFWGDVFIRSEYNLSVRQQRQSRRVSLLQHHERRAELYDDLFGDAEAAYRRSQLVQLILTHRPDVIVDGINTATGISYQDNYTAAEIAHRDLEALKRHQRQNDPAGLGTWQEAVIQSCESLMISQYIPQLVRHVVLLNRALREAGTRLYIKIGTTGTGGMGLNIPYTHGEDKPSAKLMSKTAIAFAHTGLMFLMARTAPEAEGGIPPVIKEIKPAALVGWIDITQRTIRSGGKPAQVYAHRRDSLSDQLILQIDKEEFESRGRMRMAVVDTGENGVFAKGEFEAITTLRQMEFVTPEEIARVLELEIRGINTGKDIISAIDGAIMGPSYRAGYLRHQALEELERVEEETRVPSVALGELGPPELSKLLWEAFLLKQQYSTLQAVLKRAPEEHIGLKSVPDSKRSPDEIAMALHRYLLEKPDIVNLITSVGLPILLPDGCSLLRGPFIRIPEIAGKVEVAIRDGDVNRWAASGWVDLRPENFAHWQQRFGHMERAHHRLRGKGSSAVSREDYLHKEIFIGEVVGWIFNNEMRGYRII